MPESGGVDSVVAATLSGPGAVAVTLELWADPDNDGRVELLLRAGRAHRPPPGPTA